MKYRFINNIQIPVGNISLSGELVIPENAQTLVLFSHGSGSSRFSPRNNFVAKELNKQNIGTFLFDLMTQEEDEEYKNRFNIELLSTRLITVTKYLSKLPPVADLRIGYFGASTGAASAINAAAALPELVHAVVSRGGRPDLAMEAAKIIKAPTLLIVGELDPQVIDLNRKVFNVLTCKKELIIVQGATHLFEESGTMNKVAVYASMWFKKYLEVIKDNPLQVSI